ncbi:DCP2-domain-containing protein [Myriangium duriaei CBS 260.36]|uniref:DCP2-domain-containing protein n=1 Tax=Myriangium duriaei CBS 260.36 TaxID=1168546 RepID=A0A9P4J7U8_9PEZI|nr:DCP2-domain-containing protein [Myriangium duriaei CBS 260.36]
MATQKMQLVDWLDDLCVRFIINLPQEELEQVARICFQVEEAQWFYEDFVRPIDPTLPSLNLKQFCLKIFQHCPLLSAFSDEQHLAAYQDFLGYKTRVPVRGAIMLNDEMDKVVLVKGWKNNASWSFPRGKINKDEKDLDCAIREVYEETGLDLHEAGLAPDPDAVKGIDVTMREQHMRLFVFRGIPEDTPFEPKTRKEISKIQWYRLADLPTLRKNKQAGQSDAHESYNPSKFYMVAPFLGPLKKWIHRQKKIDAQQALHEEYGEVSEAFVEEQPTQLPEINVVAGGMQDPASELKRLLSVQQPLQSLASQQPPLSQQQQASSLLAMLRGGAPAISQNNLRSEIPHTPLEQLGGRVPEPLSPHVHHVRESPFATSQPPPQYSPQPPVAQPSHLNANLSHGHSMHDGHMGQPASLPANQQNLLQMIQQRPQAGQVQPQQYSPFQQQLSLRGPVQQAPFNQQNMHQPQHDPVGPPPSQLPPPRLNNHAMGLLSAFKSGPGAKQNPALLNTLKHNPPPQNTHQNSLLDLFKAPGGASPGPPTDLVQPGSTTPNQTIIQPAVVPSPKAPTVTARRPSAMSMINRTLPKKERQPSAPSMDTTNFPTLGSAPIPVQKPVKSPRPSTASPPKQMKILSRPEQSGSSQPPSRPESRGKQPTAPQPAPKSILQRPTSSSSRGPSGAQQQQPKPAFQPQILKRGDPVASSSASSAGPTSPSLSATAAPGPAQQRDALLSLFAQTQARTTSPPSVAGLVTPPLSSGPIGGLPRQGSTASVQDGLRSPEFRLPDGGMKSPETPREKRGFLMDYLDGVVRGGK